jgi:hypothetical protein
LGTLGKLQDPDAVLNWVDRQNALLITKALHAKTRSSPVPIVQEPPSVQPNQPAQTNGAQPKTEWDILDSLGG